MIAGEISAVYSGFKTNQFVNTVTKKFPELELMERLLWIRDCLREFLPGEYRVAARVLLESLPPPLDEINTDDDYGDFIHGPYGAFVAEYGCTADDLQFSLSALKEMTKRFSVEFPIRTFINTFPKETLAELHTWASDRNYHVRRAASEGTRPKLPWAKKITIDYTEPLSILELLYADATRYVTRSVANHLNDIAKIDPDLVITTLERWQKSGKQSELEMKFITKHSLRTLEKQGFSGALKMLGYSKPEIQLGNMQIHTKEVVVGDALEFSFSITSTAPKQQTLLLDYHLYFQKKTGELAPKTFKIAKTSINPGETLVFSKRQSLRPMTTRVLHEGQHEVELQINGQTYPRKKFNLLDP